MMKLCCEECQLAHRRERWLRPCRHWRWLLLGRLTPPRKIRIVAISDAIRNGRPPEPRRQVFDPHRPRAAVHRFALHLPVRPSHPRSICGQR